MKVPEGRGDEYFGKKDISIFKMEEKRKMSLLLTYNKLKQDGMIDDICLMHGTSKPKTPKKTKRDIYKEMSKAQVWTTEEVDKLRLTHKKQMENIREAANYVRIHSLEFMRKKSREFIYITTEHVVEKLKEEVKMFLAQFVTLREELEKKDEQLNNFCDKVRDLNLIVCSYETKFASRNLYLDLRKTELDKLKVPEPDSKLAPLDARINRYLDDLHDGKWKDPTQIRPMANYHDRPLFFYGSFVSLSQGEKLDFAESEVVNYYKCIVSD